MFDEPVKWAENAAARGTAANTRSKDFPSCRQSIRMPFAPRLVPGFFVAGYLRRMHILRDGN
ncbi:hypothetical protein NXC24_PC00141 (plasmid) [Rhizobium sp. NXC24]|nr:hypothetical protein NXC24_PC00141 [Rhizobium sp. NXC24]